MFAIKQKPSPCPLESWTKLLAKSGKYQFYNQLDQTLDTFGFGDQVRRLCAPVYDQSGLGRPGIDPVVYAKMLMVGFFENLTSERAIAAHCADSIAVREFLHYELTEITPDHSSLSIIRQRLTGQIHDQLFNLSLATLEEQGLVRGKHLGIDSSIIQANASLRGLVHRQTEEAYWDYVKRLAQEQGINPQDSEAVRKFDRKRPKTMSNEEWYNPDEPEAKIGPKKDGAIDMIYKAEIVADLDTGALANANVLPGDQADHEAVSGRFLEAQQNLNEARQEPPETLTLKTGTGDKGYFVVPELQALQDEGIKTVIRDPVVNRRLDELSPEARRAVQGARRSVKSPYGKELLRRRGMHLERAFAHILDWGGMRRTTLRGGVNLNKRFKWAAAFYNVSLLMRHLFGVGTAKQWASQGGVSCGGSFHLGGVWLRLLNNLQAWN